MRNVNDKGEKGLISEKFLSPLDIKTKCKRQIGLQNMQLKGTQAVSRHTQPHSGLQIQFMLYHPAEDGHCIMRELGSGLVFVLCLRWPLGLSRCPVWWDQSSVGMGRDLPVPSPASASGWVKVQEESVSKCLGKFYL